MFGLIGKKTRCYEYLQVAFLFFAVIVVGFVFLCTDAEYNYNQQIARGFISKEAIFFSFDNLSYKKAFYLSSDMVDEDGTEINVEMEPPVASDSSFVLKNKLQDNGKTAVESLMMSGNGSYFSAIHNGVIRGVVYKGRIILPPITSGRFFTEGECLSNKPLAVIGKKYSDSIVMRDKKRYLFIQNNEYEVIGMVGFSGDSPLDDIVFLNLGSLSPEEQLNGIYYIDSSNNNEMVYREFYSVSEDLFGCSLIKRETPKAFIDIVAGGMYMKTYLKILLFLLGVIAFVNVLIQSVRRKFVEISVMKILGIRQKKMFLKTTKTQITSIISGVITGLLINSSFIMTGVFSLPITWIMQYFLSVFVAVLIMTVIWLIIIYAIEWNIEPKEVLPKV